MHGRRRARGKKTPRVWDKVSIIQEDGSRGAGSALIPFIGTFPIIQAFEDTPNALQESKRFFCHKKVYWQKKGRQSAIVRISGEKNWVFTLLPETSIF